MTKATVSELKQQLGNYLGKVKGGASIIITGRGKTVAILIPANKRSESQVGTELDLKGIGSWKGGKPKGASRRVTVKGKPVSKIVREERVIRLPFLKTARSF